MPRKTLTADERNILTDQNWRQNWIQSFQLKPGKIFQHNSEHSSNQRKIVANIRGKKEGGSGERSPQNATFPLPPDHIYGRDRCACRVRAKPPRCCYRCDCGGPRGSSWDCALCTCAKSKGCEGGRGRVCEQSKWLVPIVGRASKREYKLSFDLLREAMLQKFNGMWT